MPPTTRIPRFAILPCLLAAVGLALLVGCSSRSKGRAFDGQRVHVFVWNDYMDEEFVKQRFEERTGAAVDIDHFADDEALEQKVGPGGSGYDVVFPSDRSLAPLAKRGALAELDRDQLPNWKHLDPKFLGARHDPQN